MRGNIIAPQNLCVSAVAVAAADRRYAAAASIGLHTLFRVRQTEPSFGGDLVVSGRKIVGPKNNPDDFQRELHSLLKTTRVSSATLANRIGNGMYPTPTFEGVPVTVFRPHHAAPIY